MQDDELQLAIPSAMSTAAAAGLEVESASLLHNSSRIAVRLLPCDVLVRVAPESHRRGAETELRVARALDGMAAPIAELDPRVTAAVYVDNGFLVTFWRYFAPNPRGLDTESFARALRELHASLRTVDLDIPHFTDRVAEARGILENPGESPELPGGERQFLLGTLEASITAITLRHRPEQALHGEPHPGNVLSTDRGPLFIDLETFCRGPVEFDLAHAPQSVATFYPGIDGITLTHCRRLMLAMVAAWRWQRGDQFPGRLDMGRELIARLRSGQLALPD